MSLRQFHFTTTVACLASCFALFTATVPAAAQSARNIEPQWQLWKINADGTGLAHFADIPGYSCGSPKWSPDGSMVAYDTRRVDETLQESQIAVIDADGMQPPRLIGPGGMPSWSPDGTHLVCHTYDNPQTTVVMKADGSGRETILNHWGSPRWMPSGNRIALIGSSGGISIFDLADGTERAILSGPNFLRPGFAVSPDGRSFVFGKNNGGLYLATLDPRTMRSSITTLWSLGVCYHASWSPDGQRIVFGWKPDPPKNLIQGIALHQLFVVDIDSNELPVPLPGQNTKRNNTNPDWSPDGKTIIFASQVP